MAAGKTAKFTITATNNNSFDIFVKELFVYQNHLNDNNVAVKVKDADGKDITTENKSYGSSGPYFAGFFQENSSGDKIAIAAGQTMTFTMDITLPDTLQCSNSYETWGFDVTLIAGRLVEYENTETTGVYGKSYSFTDDGIKTTESPMKNITWNISTSDTLGPGKKVTFNFDISNGNDFDILLDGVMLQCSSDKIPSDIKITGADGKNISNVNFGYDIYCKNESDDKVLIKAGEKATYKIEGVLLDNFGQSGLDWIWVDVSVSNDDETNQILYSFGKSYYYSPSENQTVEVEKKDEKTPNIKLDSAAYYTLIDAAFTDEEIESDKKLEVDVVVAVADADAADMEKIQAVAKDGKVAVVLDITLEAFVDGVKKGNVKVLGDKITITVDIPEEYRADGRTFTFVRLHDGIAEVLTDLDNDPDTITIATDRFSLYSLIYKGGIDKVIDAVVTPPAQNDNKTPNAVVTPPAQNDNKTPNAANSPNTGDTAPIAFVFTAMLCAAFLAAVCLRRMKKQSK